MIRPPAVHGLSLSGLLLTAALAACVTGCGAGSGGRLETGYRYRPLNSTTVERRAFYSDPYSVEARMAEVSGDDDSGPRQRTRMPDERR